MIYWDCWTAAEAYTRSDSFLSIYFEEIHIAFTLLFNDPKLDIHPSSITLLLNIYAHFVHLAHETIQICKYAIPISNLSIIVSCSKIE